MQSKCLIPVVMGVMFVNEGIRYNAWYTFFLNVRYPQINVCNLYMKFKFRGSKCDEIMQKIKLCCIDKELVG